ncbi:MAG: ester cyclase [Geminicoccaceae bacterium]
MTGQKEVISELTALINARKNVPIARFFAPDFRLHDPGAGVWFEGHDGAQDMIHGLLALGPKVTLEILDIIDQGDRVAVRWQATIGGGPDARSVAMLAIYRFVDGRIAEDWGISARLPWNKHRQS